MREGAAAPSAPTRLAGREAQVARLAGEGLTDEQIAQRLGIGRSTVNEYWKRALERLGARSRTQAVALLAQGEIQALRGELERVKSREAPPGAALLFIKEA